MEAIIPVLFTAIISFLSIYYILLIIRVLLTWFPNVDWWAQPFAFLREISDPYLNLFRSLIPPMGGIDFSAMLAIFFLEMIRRVLLSAAPSLGVVSL